MKCAPLVLWLGAISVANGAGAPPVDRASIESKQVEVHSVVVDVPPVISLAGASPEAWGSLPSTVELDDQVLASDQTAQTGGDLNEIELLKVHSTANIRSDPSASAEIIGIAYAGAVVQVASRDLGWVNIIDPWSARSGWIYSKFSEPYRSRPRRGGGAILARSTQ